MTETQVVTASQPPSPLSAVGTLIAARDLEELALAAALCPAQLLGARETVVVLRSSQADIVERNPAAAGSELEQWALGELRQVTRGEEPSRQGSRFAVGIDPVDGWSGVVAVNITSPDEETSRGLVELGRIVSRCVGQIASLKRRATALEDARKSIGKGLHDLRTPLNSLRLGLHLLEPGLAGQDPQVVQRTHRAVDRLAALVTEMYEALHENTEPR
ncbi:MAG TPA: histidine kinase dimerization/phospho-acceptor domain-containing protein [Polyangiaceae bacterium]|nr:histidine kinase dimerization/phospho-acceptor domain-containing protein [Polyangiaceae bacterium]